MHRKLGFKVHHGFLAGQVGKGPEPVARQTLATTIHFNTPNPGNSELQAKRYAAGIARQSDDPSRRLNPQTSCFLEFRAAYLEPATDERQLYSPFSP